jgi:hypothetical protein
MTSSSAADSCATVTVLGMTPATANATAEVSVNRVLLFMRVPLLCLSMAEFGLKADISNFR